jgi:hypothetical protein
MHVFVIYLSQLCFRVLGWLLNSEFCGFFKKGVVVAYF